MLQKLKIAIVGAGKVGLYLHQQFSDASINVHLFSQKQKDQSLRLENINPSVYHLVLLCVPDDAIAEVSQKIPPSKALVAHVSGATPYTSIHHNHKRRGVFYPLMSFSSENSFSIQQIPFCLETEYSKDYTFLESFIKTLGAKSFAVNSEQRKHLHLAAVWSQNFTNHLYQLAYEELHKANISFDILKPLLLHSLKRLDHENPKKWQTGPAVRHDEKTIKTHMDLLEKEDLKQLYTLLTQSIQNKTHE